MRGLDAALGHDTEHQDPYDLKGAGAGPRGGDLRAANEGDGKDRAGSRVFDLFVDRARCPLEIAVK